MTRSTTRAEPAAVAEAVRLIVAALVAVGWVTLDAVTVEIVITVIGGLISLALTVWTRGRVTPWLAPIPPVRAPED